MFVLAYFCSCVANHFLSVLNSTVTFTTGSVSNIPFAYPQFIVPHVKDVAKSNVDHARNDWDSYEISWDFKRNPLVNGKYLTAAYTAWKQECEDRFQQLKKNEEELNRIFIDIYGLQDELTPDVADRDITVHRVFDSKDGVPESMKGSNYVRTMRDEIVSLISYAVGCMFGRYSLDKPGLIFAGYSKIEQTTKTLDGDDPELEKFAKQNADGSVSYGSYYHEVNQDNYKSFPIDTDNIIPICDDDYFDDDITGRFVKWVETVYSSETLEENLKFIADALGTGGLQRENRARPQTRHPEPSGPRDGCRYSERRKIDIYQCVCGQSLCENRKQTGRHEGKTMDPSEQTAGASGHTWYPVAEV